MLHTLPAHELIAFYTFTVFMDMNNHSDFFTAGVINQESRSFLATLSIDKNGNVYENESNKGCIQFEVTFSFIEHQKRIAAKVAEGKKQESHNTELYYSYYEQIPKQIYEQSLLLNDMQLSIRNNCLTALVKLCDASESEIFEVCQCTLQSITDKASPKVLH